MSASVCLRFTRRVWKSFLDTKGHDTQCFPNLVIHDATPGTLKVSLKIEQSNSKTRPCMASSLPLTRRIRASEPGWGACIVVFALNPDIETLLKTVHGGLISSLTDTLGSLAVATKGQYMTGVSTDLGTSFVRPAGRVGDVLHATAVLTGMGKALAYTRVDFTNPAGELVAYGYHTKYIGKSSLHHKNVKFSEDGKEVIEGVFEDVD